VASIVSDIAEMSAGRECDLSRLNDAELRVLRLLGEGHTVKSIASLIGFTPAAVNERLREARRKTGLGSSREVARALKAHENCHKQIRVGESHLAVLPVAKPDANVWPLQMGATAMIVLLLAIAAGAAAFISQPPTSSVPTDPVYGTILSEEDPIKLFSEMKAQGSDQQMAGEGSRSMMRGLYAKVRSEPRDTTWASETERALKAAFTRIPNVGMPGTTLSVTCARTLCEVGGTVDVSIASTEAGRRRFNDATMSKLNPKALSGQTDRLNLESVVASIAQTPDRASRMAFLFYYVRQK